MGSNTGSGSAQSSTTMYTIADWASFTAAGLQLARLAAANGGPATAMMCIAAASVFSTL
jgi:hypothetical protein